MFAPLHESMLPSHGWPTSGYRRCRQSILSSGERTPCQTTRSPVAVAAYGIMCPMGPTPLCAIRDAESVTEKAAARPPNKRSTRGRQAAARSADQRTCAVPRTGRRRRQSAAPKSRRRMSVVVKDHCLTLPAETGVATTRTGILCSLCASTVGPVQGPPSGIRPRRGHSGGLP